jgi:hypothetical protein
MILRWIIISLLLLSAAHGALADDADMFFELKIRPVLAGVCLKCHGGAKTSNGLRIDSREALLKGGDTGPAIVPGDPEKSLLIKAIRQSDTLKMPPDAPLPEGTVAEFATWIKGGARWPAQYSVLSTPHAEKHWAFQAVKRVSPPVDATSWSANPIDCFIAAKRQAAGLTPVALTDKRTLIRRVTIDLVGLPPAPEEVEAFLEDDSPDAYRHLVDRLLASPHYGERWGRHWMDVVRYADTAGDNADYPIPEVHLYRDWIIDSFNRDQPYDEFVREQLAGDLLAQKSRSDRYADQVIATGFLALSRRYATAPYELWHLSLEDAIDTTGRAFLGLTLRCARCHDHKFDPVKKEDYYALYGIFQSTQFPWAGGEEFASMAKPRQHFVPLLPPEVAGPRLAAHQQRVQELEAEVKQLEEAVKPDANKADVRVRDKLAQLQATLKNLKKTNLPADLPGAYAVQDGQPVDANIHVRGEISQPGPVVKRGVPRFLAGNQPFVIPPGQSGRLQLAQWLTRPEHPLTARVMVNRLWQHHFGKGLVATPSNFGWRGEPPTHPELLDWLAREFIASGWSIKAMHRLILTSKTYQLASSHDEANAANDSSNHWYWRHDRRRLDAEALRDSLLAVSGQLDRRRPGPQPFPRIDTWGWTQHTPFKDVYPSKHRSVYLMTQRFQRHPFLTLFDGPDTNTSTEQRTSSTVPLQALYLMNNPFLHEQAAAFARRLMASSDDPQQRIELAQRLAWCRSATPAERERAAVYLTEYASAARQQRLTAEQAEREAWTSYARVVLTGNEMVYVD